MIEISPKSIELLARRYSPVLRFHEDERFFPLLAESWLTHTSTGVWPEDEARDVRERTNPADPNRRGAALLTADRAMTSLGALAGPPIGGTRPLDLGDDPSDVWTMVSRWLREAGEDAFLDVGGWSSADPPPSPSEVFAEGDIEHLADLCSELASAMTPRVPWNPPQDGITSPFPWVAQPPHPTMYCEVTWAGSYPRISADRGNYEFPEGERGLDDMVAFTYHLLYGAREAPPVDGARHSEGQWESITLFFEAEVESRSGRLIATGSVAEEPLWVVVSRGQDRSVDAHFTALLEYRGCERAGAHPIIYVAKGTHRNYFHPVRGETFDPDDHGPHAPDETVRHEDIDGVGDFGALGLLMLGVAVLLAWLAAVVAGAAAALIAAGSVLAGVLLAAAAVAIAVAVVVLVILALVLLFWWIADACSEDDDENAGTDVNYPPEPDDSGSGDGPSSGGDGSEEPAPPGAGPGGSPSGSGAGSGGSGGGTVGGGANGAVGLPNTGSPTGKESSFADVRIVERLLEGGASTRHTSFPTDQVMENPPWWDYRGRWGVRVRNMPSSGKWESGWHRTDDSYRDWGYFAAERLLLVRNGGSRES